MFSEVVKAPVQIKDEKMAVQLLSQAQYDINTTFLRVAEYLCVISDRFLFQEWGYSSLWEFIDSHPELEFERRTAEMLMRIWRTFGDKSDLQIESRTLAEIGYTKSYLMTILQKEGLLSRSNLQEWVQKAKEMSVREFRKEINKALGKESKDEDVWVSFSFKVPRDAADIVNDAILAVAKLEGIPQEDVRNKRGELLARIIEDWRDYYSPIIYNEELTDEEKVAARLLKIKEQLEATYPGVKVILPVREPGF
ncbi:MAG: hypothetical protein N2053_05150 [Chitinispirillaceae bacterium]|nr:hypothetical protein [Chitinispirillaceae bacterium]